MRKLLLALLLAGALGLSVFVPSDSGRYHAAAGLFGTACLLWSAELRSWEAGRRGDLRGRLSPGGPRRSGVGTGSLQQLESGDCP